MHSVPLLMAVWSNAAVSGREPLDRATGLLPRTGIDAPVIRDDQALTVTELWQAWADSGVRQVRLFLPRPGRPIALGPAEVAGAAMRAGAILVAVGAGQAVLPRWVRGQLVAWDIATVDQVPPPVPNAAREAERAFAVALREETEWLDAQVVPAGDAALAALRGQEPRPVPVTLPDALAQLLTRSDRVLAIVRAARAAPEPVAAAVRTDRMAALNRLESATLTLQEAASSAWVA